MKSSSQAFGEWEDDSKAEFKPEGQTIATPVIHKITKAEGIIAVDFDGTIVDHAFPEIGKLKPYAVAALMALKHKGYELILWTCRSEVDILGNHLTSRDYLQEAVDFCRDKGIEFSAINDNAPSFGFKPLPKVYANIYIDDRAWGCLIDWEKIGRDLAGDCFWDFVHFGAKAKTMSSF